MQNRKNLLDLLGYINKMNRQCMYVHYFDDCTKLIIPFFCVVIVKTALIKENLVKKTIAIQKKNCGTKFEGIEFNFKLFLQL